MEAPISWAKLDMYDYEIEEFPNDRFVIHISVDAVNDLEVADISTAITYNDGYIYVEGNYLIFDKITIKQKPDKTYEANITATKFKGE